MIAKISDVTRLPIVIGNLAGYRPEFGTDTRNEVLFDVCLSMRAPATCQQCGRAIEIGSPARSRGEIVANIWNEGERSLLQLVWCEGCGRVHEDPLTEWAPDEEVTEATAIFAGANAFAHAAWRHSEDIDVLLKASGKLKGAMDEHVLALAANLTLRDEAMGALESLKERMLQMIPKQPKEPRLTPHLREVVRTEPEVESVDQYMERKGILVRTTRGIVINEDCLAEELDIDGASAHLLARSPQAVKDLVSAFLKLKRAA